MPIHWKFDDLLEQHDITAYRVAKEAEGSLSMGAVYRLSNKEITRFDASSLDAIITALRSLTGHELTVCDLIEYVPENG